MLIAGRHAWLVDLQRSEAVTVGGIAACAAPRSRPELGAAVDAAQALEGGVDEAPVVRARIFENGLR